jgi:hypothetical protein
MVNHIGEKINKELVIQCAYYPRPGAFGKSSPCLLCSFDKPLKTCKRSSILIKTRVGVVYKEPKKRPHVSEIKSKANEMLKLLNGE